MSRLANKYKSQLFKPVIVLSVFFFFVCFRKPLASFYAPSRLYLPLPNPLLVERTSQQHLFLHFEVIGLEYQTAIEKVLA